VEARGAPRALAVIPWSSMHGLASLLIDGRLGPDADPAALGAALTSVVARGLARRDEASGA
jgi:hypothetical protein